MTQLCPPNTNVFYPVEGITLKFYSEEKYTEEQRLRLDAQDNLAVADETIEVLEQLLEKAAKQIAAQKTEIAILKLGNANHRIPTHPWTIGDQPHRYPEWYSRQFTGNLGIQLLGGETLCALNDLPAHVVLSGDPR